MNMFLFGGVARAFPLPMNGERVRVRGFTALSELPLTPTLSPQAGRGGVATQTSTYNRNQKSRQWSN